jgi:hypothetical protein
MQITNLDLMENPVFDALSYTWSNPLLLSSTPTDSENLRNISKSYFSYNLQWEDVYGNKELVRLSHSTWHNDRASLHTNLISN